MDSWTSPRGARRRADRRRDQRGVSLIEVLVVVAVMAPLTLAGAMGMLTSVNVSAAAEQQQELSIALTSATENIKSIPYVVCGTAEEYQKAYGEWIEQRPAQIVESIQTRTPIIDSVRYWNDSSATFEERCTPDGGAQQFAVTVVGVERSVSGNIVKRNAGPPTPLMSLER